MTKINKKSAPVKQPISEDELKTVNGGVSPGEGYTHMSIQIAFPIHNKNDGTSCTLGNETTCAMLYTPPFGSSAPRVVECPTCGKHFNLQRGVLTPVT